MKINKKEQVMWLCILGVVAFFIMFMPNIESLLWGRNLKKTDPIITDGGNKTGEINEVSYPKTTNCTLAESLDPTTESNFSKKVVFTYSTSGTVTKIDQSKIYRYTDVAKYNKVKGTQAVDKIGIRQTIIPDDKTMTLTINDVMSVSEMQELTEYPVGYTELKKYLAANNYVCNEIK